METSLARKFMMAAANGSTENYFTMGTMSHLFKNIEKDEFEKFDKHVRTHATFPSKTLLKEWWGPLPKAPDAPTFYMEKLRERHMKSVLRDIVDEADDMVKESRSEDAALHIVENLMPELLRTLGNRLVSIEEAYKLVLSEYYRQMKMGDDYGVKIGYPVIDSYGGLISGDVMSVVGRPAAGKSFLLLFMAHHAWLHGHSPAFLSMEMNNLASGQRLVALDAKIPLMGLKQQKGQGITTHGQKKLLEAQKRAAEAPNPFRLMDGNLSTTVEDVFAWCQFMKPTVLFIDGAYMLKHGNPRLGRFERVAENCELLKQEIAGNLGIPVVASWQFSREAAKKMGGKKKETVGLEDIGYSDAIGQISSIVLGLMEEDNIETMNSKRVSVLKGRNGETGEFRVNWKFDPILDFSRYVEQEVSELSFL